MRAAQCLSSPGVVTHAMTAALEAAGKPYEDHFAADAPRGLLLTTS
ncbi:hypothetical protein J2X04_002530 [Lysobacter niabensis]|uniref:Uncharacterized protein n=1 Tax=Agrilutibacter niabensis TaxID=380628 RepID=A0ABU1VRN3_9GAMM|nr:hypothetical protein [Lysobacter niabensis]MDR7100149.1 hypothetical protein [Lysobacter niabensis]